MKKDTRNKRSKDKREKDIAEISRLYLQGVTQMEIAAHLGIAQSQVSYDLNKLRKKWRESSIRDFDEIKSIELAKIDETERHAWQAWNKSLESRTIKVSKVKGTKEKAGNVETSKRTEDMSGDPRYLEIVMKCVERRCKILGIDAPNKQELTGLDGGPLCVVGTGYPAEEKEEKFKEDNSNK